MIPNFILGLHTTHGLGVRPCGIGADEIVYNFALEFVGEVPDMKRNVQGSGDAVRMYCASSGFRRVQKAGEHVNCNYGVSLLLEQGRGDGAVHAAAESHYNYRHTKLFLWCKETAASAYPLAFSIALLKPGMDCSMVLSSTQ